MKDDSAARKATPLYSGNYAYFPRSHAAVARHSRFGNDKHNPGLPLQWSKEKSSDHPDCLARHIATPYELDESGEMHLTAATWRMNAWNDNVLEAIELGLVTREQLADGHVSAAELGPMIVGYRSAKKQVDEYLAKREAAELFVKEGWVKHEQVAALLDRAPGDAYDLVDDQMKALVEIEISAEEGVFEKDGNLYLIDVGGSQPKEGDRAEQFDVQETYVGTLTGKTYVIRTGQTVHELGYFPGTNRPRLVEVEIETTDEEFDEDEFGDCRGGYLPLGDIEMSIIVDLEVQEGVGNMAYDFCSCDVCAYDPAQSEDV